MPPITQMHAEPPEVMIKKATPVIFTARVASDSRHVVDTVRLLRLQWSGNLKEVSKLNDKGHDGDQQADDGIYTCTLKLKEPVIGLLSFSIDVKYKAVRTPPIRSDNIFVNVVGRDD
jgi:hypothetical protein